MKKFSSATAVILITSSSSSDATSKGDLTGYSSSSKTITNAAPVYAGYYCMGCDVDWKKRLGQGVLRKLSSISKGSANAGGKLLVEEEVRLSLLQRENQLLKERLQLLREIELREEQIDLLRLISSNAVIMTDDGWSSSNPRSCRSNMNGSNVVAWEESCLLLEHVLANILKKSYVELEKPQLFYQLMLTIFLIGSSVAVFVYIHNNQDEKQRKNHLDTEKQHQVKEGLLTNLLIPPLCPISPAESLGSVAGEGPIAMLIRGESKIVRSQLELMRGIGLNDGVIYEDQEYDGSVLSDASISVDYGSRKWWRVGIRPQPQQPEKGLDRVVVETDIAAAVAVAAGEASNQLANATEDKIDGKCLLAQFQSRWKWRRPCDISTDNCSKEVENGDDSTQVSLSSMGIAASIDYQLRTMSESPGS